MTAQVEACTAERSLRKEKVRDMMAAPVVKVRPDATLEDAASLLTEHRISSVPVVDDAGLVIGFLAEDDLFLKDKGIPFSLVKAPALFDRWVNVDRLPEIYANSRRRRVEEIMTRRVVSIDENASIGALARLMVEQDVKKVPVTDSEGRLVGIVSRADLIRLLASPHRITS